MKVGTDALVLGSWAGEVSTRDGRCIESALDVGTGSGILALMLAQRFPMAHVDAIELEPDAATQATANVIASPFAGRIVVHSMAAQGWKGRADLMVCNPPFFHNHPKSTDRKRNLARHDDTLPINSLFRLAKECLHPGGELAMVYPEDRAAELRTEAVRQGFCLWAKIGLRATEKHEVIRSLWSWKMETCLDSMSTIWDIEGPGGQGSWSEEMALRLEPFVR